MCQQPAGMQIWFLSFVLSRARVVADTGGGVSSTLCIQVNTQETHT